MKTSIIHCVLSVLVILGATLLSREAAGQPVITLRGSITFDDDLTTNRPFTSGTVEAWVCGNHAFGACSWWKLASGQTDGQGGFSMSVAGNRDLRDKYVVRVVGENPSAVIYSQDTLNIFWTDLGPAQTVTTTRRALTFNRHFVTRGSDRFAAMHLNGIQKLLDALSFVRQHRDPAEGDTLGKVAVSPSVLNPLRPPVVYTNLGIIHLHPDRLLSSDPDGTLLHEYGHYVQERIGSYSLDPRQHSGCDVSDPNYAFFEGFPTFFWRAVRLLNPTHYRAPKVVETAQSDLSGPTSCPGVASPMSVEFVVSDILFLLMNDGTNSCAQRPDCLQDLWDARLKLILGIVDREFDYDTPGDKNLDRFRLAWINRGGSRSYIDAVYAKFGLPPAPPPASPRAACLARCAAVSQACKADAHSIPERLACGAEFQNCAGDCPN